MRFRPKLQLRRTEAFFRHAGAATRYRSALRSTEALAPVIGGDEVTDITIVVCLWRRVERLMPILEMLDEQDARSRIRVVFWNNDAVRTPDYLRHLASYQPNSSVARVDFVSSPANIGGAARFVVAHRLAAEGYGGPLVMLDDDQDIRADFLRRLQEAWRPRAYCGVWAWRIHGDYWDRSEATGDETASYVGTGGSICDLALLTSRAVTRLPVAYHFLEDIWLSAQAQRRGFDLYHASADYAFTDDQHAQWLGLARAKSDFYDVLGRPGAVPRP